MFKGFEYNKDYRVIKGKSIYTREFDLLHEFLGSDNENIRFEYSTEREANNGRAACIKYVNRNRMPLEMMRRGKYVFAVRVAKADEEK